MRRAKSFIKAVLRPAMPALHATRRVVTGTPGIGAVDLGDLRRPRPISADFGADRGTPIDRYYIHGFLAAAGLRSAGR